MLFGKIPKNNFSQVLLGFLPFVFIVVISIYSVWPIVGGMGNRLVNAGDDIIITWIINQHIQKIPFNIINLFNGNIFYPYENTLFYSEIFLPSAIIAYLPVKITNLPIVAYNINLILGQLLTMTITYFWLKDLTNDKLSSLLGAITFGLSIIRMHYYAHLQMWNMHWWLASLWMIWKYRTSEKIKYLYLSAFLVIIQAWESILPVFFIVSSSVILLFDKLTLIKKDLKHVVFIIFIVFISTTPLISGYYGVSRQFNYVRNIRDAAHFSLGFDEVWGRSMSPGLYGLFLISLLFIKKEDFMIKKSLWVFTLLLFGIMMALGPVLKWQGATVKIFNDVFIPLPYGLFYYIVPGFKALRTPSRWFIVSAFAASVIVAYGFSRIKSKYKNLFITTAILIAILGGTTLKKFYPAPKPYQYPEVYSWLKYQPENVIIELPIYLWSDLKANENWRMLYSLEHKKTLVNGASGFSPPPWEEFVAEVKNNFPETIIERKMKKMGVELIIVHKDEYGLDKIIEIQNWGKNKLIWEDSKTLVYKI